MAAPSNAAGMRSTGGVSPAKSQTGRPPTTPRRSHGPSSGNSPGLSVHQTSPSSSRSTKPVPVPLSPSTAYSHSSHKQRARPSASTADPHAHPTPQPQPRPALLGASLHCRAGPHHRAASHRAGSRCTRPETHIQDRSPPSPPSPSPLGTHPPGIRLCRYRGRPDHVPQILFTRYRGLSFGEYSWSGVSLGYRGPDIDLVTPCIYHTHGGLRGAIYSSKEP